MFSKIVNLTLRLVIEELEEILKHFPEYPYQVAFSSSELRKKLILHILSKLPEYYAIIEDEQALPKDTKFLYRSSHERVCMERLICESIAQVFEENAGAITGHTPQKDKSGNYPSHWIG